MCRIVKSSALALLPLLPPQADRARAQPTVAACALWASAYVSIGYLFRSAYDQIAGQLKWGGLAFVAIILIFMIIVHFGKQKLEIAAEKMADNPAASKDEAN
jgi:hypothetical protein